MSASARYLSMVLIVACCLLGLAWTISLYGQRYFLAPETGAWRARIEMIDHCDLGETAVVGDSRAGSAFLPADFGDIRNFGFGGVTPAEDYYFVREMLKCKKLPKRFIIAISPFQFHRASAHLWDQTVSFGGLNANDLADLADTERSGSWHYFYNSRFGAEPPAAIKNWLYVHRFPPFSFAAMLGGLTQNRAMLSAATYAEAKRKKGGLQWGKGTCDVDFHDEYIIFPNANSRTTFKANAEMAYYFRKTLEILERRHVEILIAPVSVSAFVDSKVPDSYKAGYNAYMRSFANSSKNIHVADRTWVTQPNCDFSEGTHLSVQGAKKFHAIFETMKFR